MNKTRMRILELYSGVGGMHMALQDSGILGDILLSVDINPNANTVYKYNFPQTKLVNRNIQSLSSDEINNLGIDTILMSPPCQPFTRNGNKKDVSDPRTDSFSHLLQILPELKITQILMENVKGFESSEMRGEFIGALQSSSFSFREFIISPTSVGVPNTRHRYYCLAKKIANGRSDFHLSTELPDKYKIIAEPFKISMVLEQPETDAYRIPEDVLKKYYKILDICNPDSNRSCCFTKAYGRYIQGTGSIFTKFNDSVIKKAYEKQEMKNNDDDIREIQNLQMRYFTPREVCRLMSFPETFNFPLNVTDKQKYMLLGNSINVRVVAQLLKVLNDDLCFL